MTEKLKPCPFCGGEAVVCCIDEQLNEEHIDEEHRKMLGELIMVSRELKPCPFCGSEAVISSIDEYYAIGWAVHCKNPKCRAGNTIYDTEEEAIDAWNRRVQS